MLKVGGFPELLPKQQEIFDTLIKIIKETTEKFGYKSIRTPAVEKNEILMKGGEETNKQIFGLYGLAQGCEKDKKDYSLHFDLTVPLARYILDHRNEIHFPFKRLQIQPVRRGERNQKGRYKEFWQADIDIIRLAEENETSKFIYYDSEIIYLAEKILNRIKNNLKLENFDFEIHINNKKIIDSISEYFFSNTETQQKFLSLLDDFYKINEDYFWKEIAILTEENSQKINLLKEFLNGNFDKIKEIITKNNFNEKGKKGIEELEKVFNFLKILGVKNYTFDIKIIRGLDYYTGTIFETFIKNNINLGSIYSGGRYENLTKMIDNKSPNFQGVGISMGLNRFFYYLETNYQIDNLNNQKKYLFLNFNSTLNNIIQLMKKYENSENTIIELYPNEDKLKKQFKYADKKGFDYVVILGEEELKKGIYKIKDMKTGKETENELR